MNTTIDLFSGEQFNYCKPTALSITDIAHALSNICRFGGHYNVFYSVAEHSINLAKQVPEELALLALLHDCAETVIGDFPSPMKHLVTIDGRSVEEYEEFILVATLNKLEIPFTWEELNVVYEYDKSMLSQELYEWRRKTCATSPAKAEQEFLNTYKLLGGK